MTAEGAAIPQDPKVPALAILLGPDGEMLLDAVVRSLHGSIVEVKPVQVRFVPERSVTVQYRATVNWRGSGNKKETFVATSGLEVPDGIPVFEADGVEVAMWRFPADPFLPGIAHVMDGDRLRSLLEPVGFGGAPARTRVRAYRPGRRAVVEASSAKARAFIKVVRPGEVDRLQQIHLAMSDSLPVPTSHGWNRELGIVVLQALPGRTIRQALEAGSRKLPGGAVMWDLLQSLPWLDGARAVTGPQQRGFEHGRVLSAVAPDLASRVEAVVAAVRAQPPETDYPVHGDFHASQLLVRGDKLTGLIDVDTAGLGQRTDDIATMLAHLATFGLSTARPRYVDRYGEALIAEFDRFVDPAALRTAVAAAVLGYATGPFRVQSINWLGQTQRRLALAERWVSSAAAMAV